MTAAGDGPADEHPLPQSERERAFERLHDARHAVARAAELVRDSGMVLVEGTLGRSTQEQRAAMAHALRARISTLDLALEQEQITRAAWIAL
jgi:hypothetical protein